MVLKDIGRWMNINGDAIYGTDACPFYYHNVDWRCTTKGDKLYLHLLRQQEGEQLVVELPKASLVDHVDVIELTLADSGVNVSDNQHHSIRPDNVDLYAWAARFRGPEMAFDWQSNSVSNFVDISKQSFERETANFESELW